MPDGFFLKEFPDPLSKIPSLWTRSYFASTAGAVSSETIQRSIEAQKGIEDGKGHEDHQREFEHSSAVCRILCGQSSHL